MDRLLDRYGVWNDLAAEFRPIAIALVEERTNAVRAAHHLPDVLFTRFNGTSSIL